MKKLFLFLLTIFFAQLALAQNEWQVSGVVTDAGDGMGLPGVNIMVQGLQRGTVTDVDGQYSIKVPEGRALRFSYIGYKEVIRQVSSNTVINVSMETDSQMLDEVVAIGYGTMRKSDLTGAVSSVKAEHLKKTPASSMDQALQGRVAGVTVNANTGQPGQNAIVRIRGIGSAIGGSDPIYVVDGVIVENIAFLNPNDIQATEVLKDASATAIYGSRGANGVVIVTTKRGEDTRGKANISFDAYWGVQNRWNKLDLMQRDEMVDTKLRLDVMRNGAAQLSEYSRFGFNSWMEVYRTGGRSPYFPVIQSTRNPNGFDYSSVETDWQDEVFQKNAFMHSYNLSIDGGTSTAKYAFSTSYYSQEGTIIGSDYERLTLRLNTEFQARSWLKIGEHLSFMTSQGRNAMNNSSSPGASVISAALAMAPWDPTHYPEGAVNPAGKDLSGQIAASSNFENVVNPFSMVQHSHPKNNTERLVGDVYVEINPIKELTLRSAVNIDYSLVRDRNFGDKYEYSSFDKADKNFISSDMRRYSTLSQETTLTYATTINQDHSFSVMVGQTTEEYNYYTIGGSGASILNPLSTNWYLNRATEDQSFAGDGVARARRQSFLGRAHYTYSNKYMATVNFRADGSSKFPENAWGYFPSTALAWRISEEDFMKQFDNKMDMLKLRLGWGQVGNDRVGDNAFDLVMGSSSNVFFGYPFGSVQDLQPGASILTYVNRGGKWETNEQWNVGLDFSFWNGKLSGNVDYFVRDTKDALLYVNAPAHAGNRFALTKNVGVIRNQGFEIALDHQNRLGEFSYAVGGNVSLLSNELVDLNGGSPIYGDRSITNYGLPLFSFFGYEYEGVYQSNQEALDHLYSYDASTIAVRAGDARYRDINGDGRIDDDDKTKIGNPFPKLTYGLNLSADYKGFDLQMFFQGVQGNDVYNALLLRTEGTGSDNTLSTSMRDVWVGYTDPIRAAMENRNLDWTQFENRNGSIPNPNGSPTNSENSSRFVEDGSYLRLKNIQLGYTLPKRIIEKVDVQRCRVYISASNLFTLTNYTGYDPEVGSGVDYGNYPQSRTFTLGVSLNF